MNPSQKYILVVEDDDGNRELIQELLTFQGYQAVGADSGKQAITQLREHRIDLILMDISLKYLLHEIPRLSFFRLKQFAHFFQNQLALSLRNLPLSNCYSWKNYQRQLKITKL